MWNRLVTVWHGGGECSWGVGELDGKVRRVEGWLGAGQAEGNSVLKVLLRNLDLFLYLGGKQLKRM